MDPLPSWLLKQYVSLLAPFLTRLINLSIADSAVPECMKMAIVTAILKKSNLYPADISNYRPVSKSVIFVKTVRTGYHTAAG